MISCTKASQCRLGLKPETALQTAAVSVVRIHPDKSAEISENQNKYASEYVPSEQIRGPEQIRCDTGISSYMVAL